MPKVAEPARRVRLVRIGNVDDLLTRRLVSRVSRAERRRIGHSHVLRRLDRESHQAEVLAVRSGVRAVRREHLAAAQDVAIFLSGEPLSDAPRVAEIVLLATDRRDERAISALRAMQLALAAQSRLRATLQAVLKSTRLTNDALAHLLQAMSSASAIEVFRYRRAPVAMMLSELIVLSALAAPNAPNRPLWR